MHMDQIPLNTTFPNIYKHYEPFHVIKVSQEPYLQAYAGINFIHNHPPQDKPPPHDLKWAKNLPLGQSLCTKTLPSGQKKESKVPPPGDKVREFHKHIYELWHYLKWKALWAQQMKQFFNEETDY